MIDRIWRLALWVAFRLARLWWWLRRPAHDGALVAVWHAGRVLMVRQSYRPELSFPGGGIRPGEDPREAARRELQEEVGLSAAAEDLVLIYDDTACWDWRADHVRVYALRLATPPLLHPDRREIAAALFMCPEEVLATRIAPFVRACLREPAEARLREP